MNQQGIYWLLDSPEDLHRSRAAILEEIGYTVDFIPDINTLKQALITKRVSIILVGDELEPESVLKAMDELVINPDIQGARLLLSVSRDSNEASFLAGCSGFRDIIPLMLSDDEWLMRFQFSIASSNESTQLSEQFTPVNKPIKVAVPTRIYWVSGEHIWIESKARPFLDDQLTLRGALAQEMGAESLNLRVIRQERKNLAYRFSEASICSWEIELSDTSKAREVLEELKDINQGLKKKVFLAVQSPALRNTILKYLNKDLFDVHTALQKKSLTSEPKYFSPSLVFLEFRLFEGEGMSKFQDILSYVPENATIVLVGAKRDDLIKYKNFSLGRRVEALFQIPKNLPEVINNDYLKHHKNAKEQNIYLPRNHRFTLAEIIMDSHLTGAEGDLLEIKIPVGLANYGLIRLELSSGESLFAKVVGSSTPKERENSTKPLNHTITCHVNWLNQLQKDSAQKAFS